MPICPKHRIVCPNGPCAECLAQEKRAPFAVGDHVIVVGGLPGSTVETFAPQIGERAVVTAVSANGFISTTPKLGGPRGGDGKAWSASRFALDTRERER